MRINDEKVAFITALLMGIVGSIIGFRMGGVGGIILGFIVGGVGGLGATSMLFSIIDALPDIAEMLGELGKTVIPAILWIGLIVLGIKLWGYGMR